MLCGEDLGSAGFMPIADGLALAWSQQIYLSIYLYFSGELVLEMFSANQYMLLHCLWVSKFRDLYMNTLVQCSKPK